MGLALRREAFFSVMKFVKGLKAVGKYEPWSMVTRSKVRVTPQLSMMVYMALIWAVKSNDGYG